MIWLSIKWVLRLIVVGIVLAGMSACTILGLNYASLETENKPQPYPRLEAPIDVVYVRATLEDELYGPWPGNLPIAIQDSRMVDPDYLGGRGTLEEVILTIGEGDRARTFPVVLALPNEAKTHQVPLIISQTFSDNCSVFPDTQISNGSGGICDGSRMSGFMGFVATQIFGTYIAYAPVERYFDAGLGYASFSGWSFVPDNRRDAAEVMPTLKPGPEPTSTLMAWAYGYHAFALVMQQDPRIRGDAIAAMGHSRYGKSSLIAAAWSEHISAAIAHQSGFAGGSSSRSNTGETLQRMANSYPHWVRPGLAADLKAGQDLSLDQHFLLGLAAPKPLFLGNGRRDVWSDPNSSYRLAQAADVIYEAQGVGGLPDTHMRDFQPDAELSYWLRVGGHSVVSEDIDAFISFMTAHFETPATSETTLQSAP